MEKIKKLELFWWVPVLFRKKRKPRALPGATRAQIRASEAIAKKFKTDKLKGKKIIPNRYPNKSKIIPRKRWFRSAR